MALGTRILGYGGSLVALALIYAVGVGPIVSRGTSYATNNSTISEAAKGAGYLSTAADWSGLIMIFLLGVGLLAAAIYRGELR